MPRGSKKRRPAGISRSQKHRNLRFETLEDRRVMSANPLNEGAQELTAQIREQLLSTDVIQAFENAADLSQYSEEELLQTTEWIVLADLNADVLQLAEDNGIELLGETGLIPGSYVVRPGEGGSSALVEGLAGSEDVDFFYPLVPMELQSLAITNDPYLKNQWHLINFNQEVGSPDFGTIRGVVDEDINIEGAWDYVTGNGVVIGIVDSGVQLDHPDLAANIRLDLATDLTGFGDPNPTGDEAHGTATAGLAAGVGNNGLGTAGVAYQADIAPIKLFFDGLDVGDVAIAQALLHQMQEIDVYNHSWGITPEADDQGGISNPRQVTDFGPLALTALRNSVFFGRGGLGNIHVFAAGNEVGIQDSANYSGLVNSRYTIGVGGVVHDGKIASYSENGAATLVVAPTGSIPTDVIRDGSIGSGIYTTDQTGDAGFNQDTILFELPPDYFEDTDYASRFNGTSAAAPIVSGVVALMLEANPNLTYRDVQHILVRSGAPKRPIGHQLGRKQSIFLRRSALRRRQSPTHSPTRSCTLLAGRLSA